MGHVRARGFALGSLLLLAFVGAGATGAARRAPSAGGDVSIGGTTVDVIGRATFEIMCAARSHGKTAAIPARGLFQLTAADELADARLGYLAATTRAYATASVRIGLISYRLRNVRLEDVPHPNGFDPTFFVRGDIDRSVVNLPPDPNAATALAVPTSTSSPAANPSATPGARPPLVPSRSLALGGIGTFALAYAPTDGRIGAISLDRALPLAGDGALRLAPSCVSGATIAGLALQGSDGRQTFASAGISNLGQVFDERSGGLRTTIRLTAIVKNVASPQPSPT